jgi:hypothetical protein
MRSDPPLPLISSPPFLPTITSSLPVPSIVSEPLVPTIVAFFSKHSGRPSPRAAGPTTRATPALRAATSNANLTLRLI